MVFVWDNVADVEQIQLLLTRQPDCSTIVTSRRELELTTETLALGPLSATDAVALFESIAGEDSCRGMASEVSEAACLCAQMPLQIGVHASTVRRKRTIPELVAELRTLPTDKRLSTLFASFDLSYRVLSVDEQRTIRLIGIHPGPHLTAGTAAAMLGCSLADAVRLLDELVDANFAGRYRGRFDHHRGGVDIPPDPDYYAYVFHDQIREYAYHKASERSEEHTQLLTRLVEHYRARTLPPDLTPAWVQVERRCLLAALTIGLPGESNLNMALDIAGVLRDMGWFTDAEAAYHVALHRALTTHDRAGEAEALEGLADSAMVRGDTTTAERVLRAVLTIHRELGDQVGQARVLENLALTDRFRGDFQSADIRLREAETFQQTQDQDQERPRATLESTRAKIFANPEDPTILDDCEEILQRATSEGDKLNEGRILVEMGTLLLRHGSIARAKDAFVRARTIFDDAQHRHGQANVRYRLGETALYAGDVPQAAKDLKVALSIYRELGDVMGELKTIMTFAQMATAAGDSERAVQYYRHIADRARKIDNQPMLAIALNAWADLAISTDDSATARALLRAALTALDGSNLPMEAQVRSKLERCNSV